MAKIKGRKNIGNCSKEGCSALLFRVSNTLIHQEHTTPLFADGTPNLFSPFIEDGEVVMRVFEIDETCDLGHRAIWERHIFKEGEAVIELPKTYTQVPMIFDSQRGWRVDVRAFH